MKYFTMHVAVVVEAADLCDAYEKTSRMLNQAPETMEHDITGAQEGSAHTAHQRDIPEEEFLSARVAAWNHKDHD